MAEDETVRIYCIPKWVSWRNLGVGIVVIGLGTAILQLGNEFRYRLPSWFFPIFPLSGIFLLLSGSRNIVIGWYLNQNALIIFKEGIRNLDPARPNVIPWNDIREIRPRPLLDRLEVFSSRPFKAIRIPYRMEAFEEAASEVALRSENASYSISDRFSKAPYYLWPTLIQCLFFTSKMALLCLAIVLLISFFRPKKEWVVTALVVLLTMIGERRRSARCQSLSIKPVLLSLSTSSSDLLLSLRDIEEIHLASVPDGLGIRTLDVKIKMKNGETHYASPRSANPLDVFYSLYIAWENYKEARSEDLDSPQVETAESGFLENETIRKGE